MLCINLGAGRRIGDAPGSGGLVQGVVKAVKLVLFFHQYQVETACRLGAVALSASSLARLSLSATSVLASPATLLLFVAMTCYSTVPDATAAALDLPAATWRRVVGLRQSLQDKRAREEALRAERAAAAARARDPVVRRRAPAEGQGKLISVGAKLEPIM